MKNTGFFCGSDSEVIYEFFVNFCEVINFYLLLKFVIGQLDQRKREYLLRNQLNLFVVFQVVN